MAVPHALRRAGGDLFAAALAFWAIVSLAFVVGRWYLGSDRYDDLALAAATDSTLAGEPGADPLADLRNRLGGENGAVVIISGAVTVDALLGSAEPTADLCLGCLELIGSFREVRSGDPVEVGFRFWEGSTVLSVTAGGVAVGAERTSDLGVTLNAAGKVFFGRACRLVVEQSSHAVYATAVEGESVELFEFRGVAGTLTCDEMSNTSTGETVTLQAAFAYRVAEP